MANIVQICCAGLGLGRGIGNTIRVCMALGLLSLATLFWSPAAHADFGNCNNPDYLIRFDQTFKDHINSAGCTVVGDPMDLLASSGTHRHIRIIQLADSDPASDEIIAAIREAIISTEHALPRLGIYQINDVTILLDDYLKVTSGGGETFGKYIVRTDSRVDEHECYIAIGSSGKPGNAAEKTKPLIAAALFRCVEGATLRRGQIDTVKGGFASWRYDGAADWFATLAVDSEEFSKRRMEIFDRESRETPLYKMGEEASIFFDWFAYTKQPAEVMPLLNHMADSIMLAGSDEKENQLKAMSDALKPGDWLDFAKAYLDKQIVDGHNHPIESDPEEGDEWEWEDSEDKELKLEPFVLKRINMIFNCGFWSMFEAQDARKKKHGDAQHTSELAPKDVMSLMALRSVDSNELPWKSGMVSTNYKVRYLFTGMYAGTEPLEAVVHGSKDIDICENEEKEKEKPPEACAGHRKIDKCMVGKWKLSGGGPIKWMQAVTHGRMHAHVEYTDTPVIDLKEDGTSTGHMSGVVDSFSRSSHSVFKAHGTSTTSGSANWSVHKGTAYFCETSSTGPQLHNFHAERRFDNGDVIKYKPRLRLPKTRVIHMRYTCSGDTLHMVLNIGAFGMGGHTSGMGGALPPMPFTYTRVKTVSEDDKHEHE